MSSVIRTIFKRCVVFFLLLMAFTFSTFPAEITVSVTVADTTTPAAVTNLTATTGIYPGEINLTWTTTGDDDLSGTISSGTFTIQYSTWTEVSWSTSSAQVTISTSAVSPGSISTYQLTNLSPGSTYYIKIWTADEVPNWSPMSIGATTWAQTDQIAPAAITDLSATCASDGTGKVTLTWTAPKEDGETGGAVNSYDLRYATWNFTNYWDSGTQWTIGVPTGAAPGTPRSLTIMSLANDATYYFIVKSTDNAGNISETSNITSTYVQHIVISEVQIAGTTASEEFVELYNPLGVPINLQSLGLKLHIRDNTGNDVNKTITFTNSVIPAYGYFLFAPDQYTGDAPRDAEYSAALSSAGAVYISTSATNFDGSPGPWGRAAIDLVGLGAQPAGGYETQTTTSPVSGQSVERRAKGGLSPLPGESGEFLGNAFDTNNNNNDFVVRTLSADPQNSSSSREPDTIPPAAVTDLTASSEISGTIKLTWSTPGDDGWSVTLSSGSQYKIQYSTDVLTNWTTGFAQITISTSGVTPGTTVSTVITDLTDGGTYYLRLWTADKVSNWSEISNAATTYLEILSINVNLSALNFGTIAPDTSFNIATTLINITNSGNVNLDFVLSCSSSSAWTVSSSTPTTNTEFRLLGIFNTGQPQASDYEVHIDTITNTPQTATGTRYDGNQTGNDVPPSETRNLWLCFSAPRSTPTRTTQSFTVSITVQKSP